MKIKAKRMILILAGMLCFTSLNAQVVDPLSFFPHHEGDVWEYLEFEDLQGVVDTVQSVILTDSLTLDGKYYIRMTEFGTFLLDTLTYNVYTTRNQSISLKYKLNATLGDSWVMFTDSVNNIEFIGQVEDVFTTQIFNRFTTVKKMGFYGVLTNYGDSLWFGSDYLASNFGIVQTDFEFANPGFVLVAARIDSVQYGTFITGLKDGISSQFPNTVNLYQNYPNPFNPETTIQYDLHRQNKVELAIYDVLGRKVAVLVNKIQPPGSYQVRFDGRGLPSGVYIYQLRTPFAVFAQKMILTQ